VWARFREVLASVAAPAFVIAVKKMSSYPFPGSRMGAIVPLLPTRRSSLDGFHHNPTAKINALKVLTDRKNDVR
jgi:hypothetical protein